MNTRTTKTTICANVREKKKQQNSDSESRQTNKQTKPNEMTTSAPAACQMGAISVEIFTEFSNQILIFHLV